MSIDARPPTGPRGAVGAAAEVAAAAHLEANGWTVLARNVRVGPDEIDIVALEPGSRASVVIVEVRSRSGRGFGSALESVDGGKVRRLYRAAMALRRGGHPAIVAALHSGPTWRVDLLTLRRSGAGWAVEAHLRGLTPP